MFLHCSAIYLGLSSNSNSNPFFEYYLNQVLITTCKGTSNFLIQVSQSKFTILKIMSRNNFGEFMKFLPKGLDPFKIQTRFKLDLIPNFLIQNPERFGS
jgi:hypothetical protein